MNTEQANAIPLSSILQKLNIPPVKQKGPDMWYNSPFRQENTASFHIHTGRNVWYDFGEALGGSVIDFVIYYLKVNHEDHTVPDALRWLENMQPSVVTRHFAKEERGEASPTLQIQQIAPLRSNTFIDYLSDRGIKHHIARKYLKEAHVFNKNTGNTFSAMALPNESGGYELRNRFFKGSIAPKTVSFFRGRTLLPQEIHLFEGSMDFLSALAYHKTSQLDGDVIILNSVACLPEAIPYIKNYSYRKICTWFDNDLAGQRATEQLRDFTQKHRGFSFLAMNKVYAGHKDVNAWHKHRLEL